MTKNRTRKNLGKMRGIKTVRNLIIKPPSNKKGTVYLIEPLKTTSSEKGDIIKKYVNGKLVNQMFASSKKIKMVVKKVSDQHKKQHGGKTPTVTNEVVNGQKVQIESSDKTTFFQSLKSGFAGGFGFALAIETVEHLFDGIFDQ